MPVCFGSGPSGRGPRLRLRLPNGGDLEKLAEHMGGIFTDRWDFAGLANPRSDDNKTAYRVALWYSGDLVATSYGRVCVNGLVLLRRGAHFLIAECEGGFLA